MSLATRIESLVIRVAQEFNDVRATAGNLASLSTPDKSSLVAAINELKAAVLSATAIDDNQIATSTTYSSNKIVSLLDAPRRTSSVERTPPTTPWWKSSSCCRTAPRVWTRSWPQSICGCASTQRRP